MKNDILKLLARNARFSVEDLAKMTGRDAKEVAEEIASFEKEGVIRGYKAVVDWDRFDDAFVSAIVELKVVPQADHGFEEVAKKVASYSQVESVYLMSGAYDLSVLIEGKTMKEVAYFVAQKLAPIESIISTATHFVLHKYKDKGVVYGYSEIDERGNCN